jgi:hypothetical protein
MAKVRAGLRFAETRNDEVRGGADQRGHAAEDGAEGERHQHAAGRHSLFRRHLDRGRHQQCQGTHVVHERGQQRADSGEHGDGESGA